MSEPILDPTYWNHRLKQASKGHLHHAVFRCPVDRWEKIETRHRLILAEHIKDRDNVLDCGCGYGRLLTLLPPWWKGAYLGLDLSSDMIGYAKHLHPERMGLFDVADLQNLSRYSDLTYDWAVLVSVRPMVIRNCGQDVWDKMEKEIRLRAKRLLYLEYDPEDKGSVE